MPSDLPPVIPVTDTRLSGLPYHLQSTLRKCIIDNHLLSWRHHGSQAIITETKIFKFELDYLATLSACRQWASVAVLWEDKLTGENQSTRRMKNCPNTIFFHHNYWYSSKSHVKQRVIESVPMCTVLSFTYPWTVILRRLKTKLILSYPRLCSTVRTLLLTLYNCLCYTILNH
jgi:hypothetical protein